MGPARPSRSLASVEAVALLAFGATAWLYYPGFLSPDSWTQFTEASTWEFRGEHPPVLALLWSLIATVLPGPFGMVLLQAALYWSGLALYCRTFPGMGAWRSALLLALGLYPPVFGLLGVVWKDVFMLGCLTAATGLLATGGRPIAGRRLLAIAVILIVAAGARHNSFVAVVPFAFWMAVCSGKPEDRERPRAVMLRGAVFACVLAVVAATLNRLPVRDPAPPLWRFFMFYDIAAIAASAGEGLPAERFPFLLESVSAEEVRRAYSSVAIWHPQEGRLFRHVRSDGHRTMASAWWAMVRDHPAAYFRHRLSHFAGLLNVGHRAWNPVYFEVAPNRHGYAYRHGVVRNALAAVLWRLTRTPIYATWIYLAILVPMVGLGIHRYRREGEPDVLVLASSGSLYLFSFLPTAVTPDFRYGLWTIQAALLGIVRVTLRRFVR